MSLSKTFYRWRPHPWHGLDIGEQVPDIVNAYIEMTPFDSVKYEVDKTTGYLRVDRPQLTSSMPPTLYGFVPRTYCGTRVQALSPTSKCGDHDPLDICVITERPINRGEVILRARVIGGVQMVDHEEADDKIIAVLHEDRFWGHVTQINQIPASLCDRLRHYLKPISRRLAMKRRLRSLIFTMRSERRKSLKPRKRITMRCIAIDMMNNLFCARQAAWISIRRRRRLWRDKMVGKIGSESPNGWKFSNVDAMPSSRLGYKRRFYSSTIR